MFSNFQDAFAWTKKLKKKFPKSKVGVFGTFASVKPKIFEKIDGIQ